MKRTRRKNIFRGIRSSLNRFLSILFIVALGAGFMAGLASTSPDMYETADRYMDDYNWYDIDVKSTLGMTKEDADAIAAVGGLETILPAKVMDMVLTDKEQVTYTSRVYALLDEKGGTPLNQLVLKEGRLPQSSEECVIQARTGQYLDSAPKIGDVITLSKENTDYWTLQDYVQNEQLTVVGIVESPMCISIIPEPTNAGSGSLALDVYTTQDFFTFDFYTDVYLTVAGARELDTFGDEYTALVDDVVPQLETIGDKRAPARAEVVKAEAQEKIGAMKSAVELLENITTIKAGLTDDAVLRAGQTAQVEKLLEQTETTAAPKLAGLLNNTAAAVERGLTDSEDDAVALTDAKEALAEAQDTVDSLSNGLWLIRTREDDLGYNGYESNVGKVSALAKIFPVFFFLVALLVALTAMTRLVEENRTQIGTLKALGFTNGQVLAEYLLYSLGSSVLGCALGFVVGFRLFPKAISSAYSMMFMLPDTVTPFRMNIAAWVAPVTICSILLATLWACWSEFVACPAELMTPKAPAAGKRIWLEHLPFLWDRISFTHKVTCRNLFRYKKRFFMTIIGVAGCSALLVTGFGLRDSINDIVDKQFGEIYKYELTMIIDDAEAVETDATLHTFLTDKTIVSSWLSYSEETGKVSSGNGSETVTVSVPQDPDAFSEFVTLRERKTQNAISLGKTGAVLTEKLCETLGVKVGDSVTIENEDGRRAEVTVTGITENYITSFAYVSPETYLKAFGKKLDFTVVLCQLSETADTEEITVRALESDHAVYARSSLSLKDTFADSIKSIDGVILVLILAAGLLCMVVLYNLTNVNICERRKELATIRVLGFHEHEVERYIFRETNILSFLGAFVGLFIGIWLHSYVVRTVEIDQVMFGRNIYLQSFLFAMIISVLFTLLVNHVMRRQIRKIDMVEAMKAND